jgi:hypothetical protein
MTEAEELELLELEEMEAQSQASPQSAEPGKMGAGKAALLGGAQGATLGFGDEVGGVIQALGRKFFQGDGDKDFADLYREERDAFRSENAQAEQDQGGAYLAGNLGGGIITAPLMPGGAGASGLKALVKSGAALGAVSGAGSSEADTLGGVAADTALGGVLGGVSGAVGKGIEKGAGYVLGKARGAAQKMVGKAVSDSNEQQAAKLLATYQSAQGKARSAIQSASRDLEVLEREAATGTGEVAEQARNFLGSDKAQALKERVLTGKLTTAPERISEMEALEAAARELVPTDEKLAAAVAGDLSDPAKKHLLPRARTLAARSLPWLIGAGGVAMGEPEIAAPAAGLLALTYGRPGTIFRNAMAKPGVRKAAGEAALKFLRKAGKAVPDPMRYAQAARAIQPEISGAMRPALAEEDEGDRPRVLAKALRRR